MVENRPCTRGIIIGDEGESLPRCRQHLISSRLNTRAYIMIVESIRAAGSGQVSREADARWRTK